MSTQSIKVLAASFILVAPFFCTCKSKGKVTQYYNESRRDVSKYESASQLISIDLFLIDSIVELTPRDTTTRVRYVRASSILRDTIAAAATEAKRDTTAAIQTQTNPIPNAVQSNKSGVTGLCPHCKIALCIIFLIFLIILVLYVKKKLFLPHD